MNSVTDSFYELCGVDTIMKRLPEGVEKRFSNPEVSEECTGDLTVKITMITLFWVTVLIGALVLYLRQVYSSFSRNGVKHLTPIPFLGNVGKILLRQDHIAHDLSNLYHSFPEERFVGRYEFTREAVVIRDIELLKKITVKDFEYFLDHSVIGIESSFGRSLFFLKGEEWKEMRSALSPAFTSSKISLMVPFMVEVGDQMICTLKKQITNSRDNYVDVDVLDLTTRYSNDVIASCAFGLKTDSQTERNNELYLMSKSITDFTFTQFLLFFLMVNVPYLLKILDWELIPKKSQIFFKRLVLDTMKERELRNILRPDMIHLLMEAKKGKLSHDDIKPNDDAVGFATAVESTVGNKERNRVWTDDDLVAQALLFLFGGFESVSTSMNFALHELAVNPDVQERLAQEIREHDAKNDGKFDFKSIQDMPYLDMVVSEVLRKWPPNAVMDRVCTKDYNMGKPNNTAKNDFILKKGTSIIIPAFAFHHDPEFYPDPEKFDPERFSKENKHKINRFAYMPFGLGPRNCIGSRFALCDLKVMVYQVLKHIELSPCEKTCIPSKLVADNINLRLQGGHWLRFRMRK
ncbi:hypothetical protein PYW08_016833 [Mythimna loreyi]|uniref:Uncharacterized protein n=1 Tax=Mythimna loreyi TaxID=667449 RepID=A0ACC2QZ52_9NEOP|nr:hypothetical protein PYW08_016833 [Mythimna loreyi]